MASISASNPPYAPPEPAAKADGLKYSENSWKDQALLVYTQEKSGFWMMRRNQKDKGILQEYIPHMGQVLADFIELTEQELSVGGGSLTRLLSWFPVKEPEEDANALKRLLQLQAICREGAAFCLDVDADKATDYTLRQRMVGFYLNYPAFSSRRLPQGYILLSGAQNGFTPQEMSETVFSEEKNADAEERSSSITPAVSPETPEELTAADILAMAANADMDGGDFYLSPEMKNLCGSIPDEKITGADAEVFLASYVAAESLEDLMFYIFSEMLRQGMALRRCRLCRRYFALPDRRRRDFCDRPYPPASAAREKASEKKNRRRTCKQAGAKIFYNRRVEEDMFLQAYNTTYNRMYARYFRNRDFGGTFHAWTQRAQTARQDYLDGTLTGMELLKILTEPL